MVKVCNKCGQEKSLIDGFHVNKKHKDGRQGSCKECCIARTKAWAEANPDRVSENNDRRYRADPEKSWAQAAKWVKDNPEGRRRITARWAEVNPESKRSQAARWRRDNPDKVKAKEHRRRALLRGIKGPHYTAQHIRDLFRQQGGLCAYCGAILASYHADHIIPLARGGSNKSDNIALACPACNLSKGSKLLGYEWCACGTAQGVSIW